MRIPGIAFGDPIAALRALARSGDAHALRAVGAYVKQRRQMRSALERARRQRRRRRKNGGQHV